MSELSEIQNNIFFLSHKDASITPATFNNDRYIDDEQAEFFSNASKSEPYVEADKDYPFTLIDHFTLDSDLVILYNYDCIFEMYPDKAYLSRHNISIADYTDHRIPPEIYLGAFNAIEPFHKDRVNGVRWTINNRKIEKDEMIHKSVYTIENYPAGRVKPECNSGYVQDTTVIVKRGSFAVWVGETYAPQYVRPIKSCQKCLPGSSCPHPPSTHIVKWIPRFNKCAPTIPRPKSTCVTYPKEPETKPSLNTKKSSCITCN